jgi:ketosteroid isomerase-like protein
MAASSTQGQILRLERDQADAINHGDVRRALRMFDKSFVGFSSTQHDRIRGLAALARTFHYYLRRTPKMNYRILQPHVHVDGNVAVATFYWTVGLGRGRALRGRATHVFVRKGKNWRVIHEHFSRAH